MRAFVSAKDSILFLQFSQILKFNFSLLYLDSAWKMHSNEYEQAQYWSPDSWNNIVNWKKKRFQSLAFLYSTDPYTTYS